jgi:hypothetical protein
LSSYYEKVFKEFPLAEVIWKKKYKDKSDDYIVYTWSRVAHAISGIEVDSAYWYKAFNDLLCEGYFIPGGRITVLELRIIIF